MNAKRLVYFSVFISLAGLLGLFLSLSAPKGQASKKTEDVKLEVLIATQDIRTGRLYSASLFEWKSVDKSEINNLVDYIQKDKFNPQSLHNQVIRGNFKKGHVMSSGDFLSPDKGGFLSVMLRPGYRAVSVPVDQVTANSGLVGPGDYVDVLLLASQEQELRKRGNETQSLYVKTIAQNVRVLAFNDAIQTERYIEAQKKYKGFIPENSAVTLEVSPEQANKVILANQLGTLSMVLRNSDDVTSETMASSQVNIDDIFPDIKQVQPDIGLVEFRAKTKRVLTKAGSEND